MNVSESLIMVRYKWISFNKGSILLLLACRYAPGNISLHWERAKMYLEVQEYKKCLDIYQQIVKVRKVYLLSLY